jgi:hypothetical protein
MTSEHLERAMRLVHHAEDLVNQFDEVVYREKCYHDVFDQLKWLFSQPGPIRKTDVKAIISSVELEISASLLRDMKKLVPDWIPPNDQPKEDADNADLPARGREVHEEGGRDRQVP